MGLGPSEAVRSVGAPRHTRAVKFDGALVKDQDQLLACMCDCNFHVDVK